ncbi:MAG: hypothetical protein C0402_06355 [Thermodesulfovibrio sp.]|nr:hypothetical protein [Thermodesulfovibrio sp.]
MSFRIIAVMAVLVFFLQGNTIHAEDRVLAKFNNREITSSTFETLIKAFPPERQKFLADNPHNKRTVLERLVQVSVISEIARQNKLDQNAAIKAQIENITNEILTQEYIKAEVAKIVVSDKDAEQYYKAHQELFKVPEMVKARHILVKFDKGSSEAEMIVGRATSKAKAESLLARVRAGEDFGKLAAAVSDDTGSKSKGGDLGFFPKGKMVPQFDAKAFSMKPGEISDIVESKFGYHIILVEEKKVAGVELFAAVKEKSREKVFEEMKKLKTEEIIKNAMAAAKVVFTDPAPPKPDKQTGPPPGSRVMDINPARK